jgi:hypothetical protein
LIPNLVTREDITREYIKCACSFEYTCETYFKIEDKRKGKFVPFDLLPHQKNLFDIYETKDKVITNKYRQSGITSVTLAYLAWKLMFVGGTKVCLVANKLNLAQKGLFKPLIDFIKCIPEEFRPEFTEADTKVHKILDNKSELFVAAASPDGIRGFSPNIVLLDEMAFFQFGHEFFTATIPSISMGGKMFCISTPSGRSNLFYEIFDGARTRTNDFHAIELKWYHDSRLIDDLEWVSGDERIIEFNVEKQLELISKGYKPTSNWYRQQCKNLNNDPQRIAQELEGVFTGSGGTVVPDEKILEQETKNVREPEFFEGIDKNMWLWKQPDPEASYILGSDVSLGNANDYSTIFILDIHKQEQVAEYQGKIRPDELGLLIDKWGRIYNNAYVAIDVTGGLGVVTVLKLMEVGYPNLHYSDTIKDTQSRSKLNQYARYDGKLPGFQIGTNRFLLIDDLISAFCGEDPIIIRSSRFISEIKSFVNVSGRADHTRSAHDDILWAAIIVIHILYNNYGKVNKNIEKAKVMIDSWLIVDNVVVEKNYGNNNYNNPSKNNFDNNFFIL